MSLVERGYVVLDTWCSRSEQTLTDARKEFMETVTSFPEFAVHAPGQEYVMGGFAALGNPASFHNMFVRRMRQWCMAEVIDSGVLAPYLREGFKLEQIVDRMMLRRKGTSVTAESWHRDEAALAVAGDKIFGGWINLDEKPQYFSCISSTHKEVKGYKGFAKVSKEQQRKHDAEKTAPVEIKPGQILVFHENLLHEVLKSSDKREDRYRLFLGWRVTCSDSSLIPGIDSMLDEQAVMPLKSNQTPPMYAKLHWTNHTAKLQEWSRRMRPQTRELKAIMSGNRQGQTFDVVHREMRSLRAYGLPMYPTYTTQERKIVKPRRSWRLLVPGMKRVYKDYGL